MPLTEFNDAGDLPVGIHVASIGEVGHRFGAGTEQRQHVTQNLLQIYRMAMATGKVDRFLIFGSYITAKSKPNDVDIVLVMADDFNVMDLMPEARGIFDHQQADARFGASIFWVRRAMLFEPLEQFVESWQNKRDGTKRGIIEVRL